MGGLLIFLLIFAIIIGLAILISVLNFITGILRYLFTFGGHLGHSKQNKNSSTINTEENTTKRHKHKLTFDKNEAEDVTFEEIKEEENNK